MPEFDDMNEEQEQQAPQPPKYEELVVEEPERKIDLSNIQLAAKTLDEEEEDTAQTSDIKAILKALTPTFRNPRINELCKSVMVSRVFPDNYMDKHFLIAASLIEEEPNPDVIAIISQTQDALSIGFEGRGIADRLEIAGVAHESELENLAKEIGM